MVDKIKKEVYDETPKDLNICVIYNIYKMGDIKIIKPEKWSSMTLIQNHKDRFHSLKIKYMAKNNLTKLNDTDFINILCEAIEKKEVVKI